MQNQGHGKQLKLSHSPRILYYRGRVSTYLLVWIVVISQHGPLSLYTKLEGPSLMKLDFYLPWMIFKQFHIFMVTTLGLCAKRPT